MKKYILFYLILVAHSASFSQYYLASGYGNGTVKIWDLNTNKPKILNTKYKSLDSSR